MLGLKVQDNADFGAEIIRKVREHDGLSRVELARELKVAASTIGRHVDALVNGGYFKESLEPTREAGRPPTRLRPNPRRGCFLGVDFHADMLFASAVDFAQKPLTQKSFPIRGSLGVESVLEAVSRAFEEMQEATNLPVLAAGIATPGHVDAQRGMGLKYSTVPGFENVPLAAQMSEVVKAPAFVENNIRTMALAERWFGEGRGSTELLCLGVRLGLTAGVIRNGNLSTGHRELGGQIRTWNCPAYDAEKESWTWSAENKLDALASVPAVLTRYAKWTGAEEVSQEKFLAAATAGDELALRALKEAAAVQGWAISQMVQLVDPELVVLAGPLTTLGETYLEVVTAFFQQFAPASIAGVPIHSSELGEFAGAIGAAALALERWRPDNIA